MLHILCYFPILAAFVAFSCTVLGQSSNYDVREATIEGVHNALYSGLTTCRGVVESFIARIEAFNPTINAIITLNPNAITIADNMDTALAAGNASSPLFCIPILLKDNYDTSDMPTTGGCLDLADSQPSVDALSVTAFKKAGAIILGKTNLHELALEGISVSSLGGQTINPYDHTRTPGGSSGGTGAAIATSFAVFGTGTDTVNSLRNPASANSLFSIRPTRGLISRDGIIPISFTQDMIGPIARTVTDVATALTVMASIGYNANDNATSLIPPSSLNTDYTAHLHSTSLAGLRFGLLEGFINRTSSPENTPVHNVLDAFLATLVASGATITSIISQTYNATSLANLDVQTLEYRQAMDIYLSSPLLHGTHPASLTDLYNSGKYLILPTQYPYVATSLASSPANTTYATKQLAIRNLTTYLESTFSTYKLDFLLYPEQRNLVVKLGSPSQSGRNGILAALTGFPVVTVPAGFSPPSADAPVGVPVGVEILGRRWEEATLLGVAKRVEEIRHVRKMPAFANTSVESIKLGTVPVVVPNRGNIPSQYPIGVR